MSANYLKLGSYNVICDRCRQKHKREDCQKEWTGLLVCKFCWDRKHPYLQPLPIAIDSLPQQDARTRPTSTYTYTSSSMLTLWGGPYLIGTDLVSDLTWENWDAFWDGDDQQPFNSTNFPLR